MVIADVDFVRNFVVVDSSVRTELRTTNQSFVLAVVESEAEGLTTLTLPGWTECIASSPLTSTAVVQSSLSWFRRNITEHNNWEESLINVVRKVVLSLACVILIWMYYLLLVYPFSLAILLLLICLSICWSF